MKIVLALFILQLIIFIGSWLNRKRVYFFQYLANRNNTGVMSYAVNIKKSFFESWGSVLRKYKQKEFGNKDEKITIMDLKKIY